VVGSSAFRKGFKMNEITYEIGRRIYKVRKEYNWTQQKLADKSGVSCAYISRLENGNDFCPTVGLLCEIARALKVSPKWIIFGDENEKEEELA